MADLIPFMYADLAAPAATTIFASDAQGPGEVSSSDHGGYGIVAASVDEKVVTDAWRAGVKPGRSVLRLDGTMGANWKTSRLEAPTVPFTRLGKEILEADWQVLAAGRWRMNDHITLGEGRAHVRIVQALSSMGAAHGHRILCLEDNSSISAAMTKGRSPAYALNFLCRRRSAASLAAQITVGTPWVETSAMPAGDASRLRAEVSRPAPSGQDHRQLHQKVSPSAEALHHVPH